MYFCSWMIIYVTLVILVGIHITGKNMKNLLSAINNNVKLGAVAQDVVIERIEPDPATQEFPCPHQIVQYKCQTLIPLTALTWRLPSGDTLPDFTGGSSVGRVRNSSDDQFSATLTGKMEDGDPNTDLFFFTSTLLIVNVSNDSTLT